MSKTRLIPFDLEKAKTGAKLVTRDGYPARLIFDSAEGKPLVALIKNQYEEYEFACLYYNDGRYDTESFSGFDLFIEENVEEPDDYNPYKETVESIADMVERYANNGDLQDFYDNVKAKCKDAFEYDKKWCKNQDEQKPIDKVEPKFKVGDWVIDKHGMVQQITNVRKHIYKHIYEYSTISYSLGILSYSCFSDNVEGIRLWDIKDAKPGDVLFHSDTASNGIFIFKEIAQDGEVVCYCDYDSEDGFCFEEYHTCCWADDKILYPATKKQRDLLFQKMKEEGYEWNSSTKELKKIDAFPVEKDTKIRSMTNQELADWLRKCPEEFREFTFKDGASWVYSYLDYLDSEADEPAKKNKLIRRNHREWQEPLIDIK